MHDTHDVRKSMELEKSTKRGKTCPIKQDQGDKTYDCHKEGCGWWSYCEDQCAVLAIATHLRLATTARDGPEW